MTALTKEIREVLGDPSQVIAEMAAFERDNNVFSVRRDELMTKYPGRWIALYDGDVRADAPSLERLLAVMDENSVPRERTVIRHMVLHNRRMIL